MRIIKILLSIVVLLFFLVPLTGLLVPTFEYGNSIDVQASQEKCWQVYHDTARMKRWSEGFESLILKKGKQLETGSEYVLTINQGEVMEMNQKIVSIDVPRNIVYELKNDVLKSTYSYAFTETSATTKITTHHIITGNNIFMKAILFFSKSYFMSADQQALEKLKAEIEST